MTDDLLFNEGKGAHDDAAVSLLGQIIAISKAAFTLDRDARALSEEEAFMRKSSCPGYEKHRKEHQAFIAEVLRQIKGLSEPDKEAGFMFYRFLGTWLLNHIAKSDREWADFIAKDNEGK